MVQLGEVQIGVKKSGQPTRIIPSASYERAIRVKFGETEVANACYKY